MKLDRQVGLGPGHIVLDGDPATSSQKGHSPPIFGPCLLWPNGRPSQLLLSTRSPSRRKLIAQLRLDCSKLATLEKPATVGDTKHQSILWPPYGIGQAIMFLPSDFYLSSFFFA